MGTWGTAIYSDDLATDVRADFRELIGDGLTPGEATERLKAEYSLSLNDPDEMPVFWIALALAQWKLGRLEESTKQTALQVIDDGTDLARWKDEKDRAKRALVLAKVRAELISASPPAKRVPQTIKEANDWEVGETIGFQLLSGRWTMFRVIGHHTDKGGRFAICELLDWVGDAFPSHDLIAALQIKRENTRRGISQFIFQEPRRKKLQSRITRLGCSTTPQQTVGGYTAFVWPYVDKLLKEIFGLQ